ncbi:MAG: hypothetical protein CVU61_05615 [Deltaproteobacteria bacterium HGW-Deltaproteobacteria-19]|jgi:hypothetical protein|nr:MAG: hypothetical protein CVU61_05615 [Deltaproteobacteria bacterium HGW-Deltaproteobacteria-19]
MPQPVDKQTDFLIKAVSPSLFTAVRYPDLIVALLIANLLSPKLWELAGRIRSGGGGPGGVESSMKKLHKFVNRNFYHTKSIEFFRIWGLYEREAITDPDELFSSDRAMSIIKKGMEVIRDPAVELLNELIDNGAAPRYVYPTVDVILAYGRFLKDMKTHPLGMTSCLDECVLIASLALASGSCRMEDVVFVGSPLHYTLYLFPDDGGYMFNAKREFFSRPAWLELTGGDRERSSRMFLERLYICDRIITPFGYCVFPDGPATIPPGRMAEVAERIALFLSAHPKEISQALETSRRAGAPGPDGAECIDTALPMGREAIEAAILRGTTPDRDVSVLDAALYAFRHPLVREPALYREAAMRGFKSFILSGGVSCVEDAQEIADGIAGRESIYGPTSRIAMPDEVLAFDTANDEERDLLVETLLRHSRPTP